MYNSNNIEVQKRHIRVLTVCSDETLGNPSALFENQKQAALDSLALWNLFEVC